MSKKENCPGCGKDSDSVSVGFRSVRHEHHNSAGIVKKFYLKCEVRSVVNDEEIALCDGCKVKLSSGMAVGGNLEYGDDNG